MKTPIITTQSFALRPPVLSDAADFVASLNSRRVSRYMSRIPYPYSLADARVWLRQVRRKEGGRHKNAYHFVIEQAGCAIGVVSLEKIEERHQAVLGYWLGESYWGQGIMTQAVRLVTNFGFSRLGLRRVYAYVFEENYASRKVLLKNGFRQEALMRKARKSRGRFSDLYLLAKVR